MTPLHHLEWQVKYEPGKLVAKGLRAGKLKPRRIFSASPCRRRICGTDAKTPRDRKTKKDAFYFYKANWSDEPTLYITSRRFTGRTNAVTDVKIYSNAKSAQLSVNGHSQGKQVGDDNNVFIWKNITLSPGENKIEASATANGQPLTDECVWELSLPGATK